MCVCYVLGYFCLAQPTQQSSGIQFYLFFLCFRYYYLFLFFDTCTFCCHMFRLLGIMQKLYQVSKNIHRMWLLGLVESLINFNSRRPTVRIRNAFII